MIPLRGEGGDASGGSVAADPASHGSLHGARDGGACADAGDGEQRAQRDAASQQPAEADDAHERQIGTLLELILELRVELLGFQGSSS